MSTFVRGLFVGSIASLVLLFLSGHLANLFNSNLSDGVTHKLAFPIEFNLISTVVNTSAYETTADTGDSKRSLTLSKSQPRVPLPRLSTDSFKPVKYLDNISESVKSKATLLPERFAQVNDTSELLSKDECKRLFGGRTFLSLDEKRLPPMLYTFPGSGNTWGRLLIEYATGVYTGSVYNDKSLLEALPGEFTCDWRVSAVKVHPHTHAFSSLRDGTFHSDENKCKRGNVRAFKRAIMLIRDPYSSIWSEYQRRVTQSHVDGILQQSFQWSRWQANAAQLANEYYDMWNLHYMGIERAFPTTDYLYVRYEDLKNKSTRLDTLEKVVKFLNIKASRKRLECAFISAESPKAHRSIDPDLEMTKELAYTQQLACRMWNLFGRYCVQHGYHVWAGFQCDSKEFPPIHRVNVGPRGEYDHSWVKPGQKLLDFGGYSQKTKLASESAPENREKGVSVLPSDIISTPYRLSSEDIEGIRSSIVSMSIDDAMAVSGVGRLGEEGPVWN